jgi:hypothetical protein
MRGLRRCQQQLGSFVILGSGRGSIQQQRAFVIQRRFEQFCKIEFKCEVK